MANVCRTIFFEGYTLRMSSTLPTSPAAALTISPAELFWLTAGAWLGGACVLALLPVLLAPRLGAAPALTVSYLLFFMAWQPIQRLTQRALGPRQALLRTLAFVGSAAALAYYVREALLSLVSGAAAPL